MKPPTLSIIVAGALFDMSKNTAYAAAKSGELVPGVPVIQTHKGYRVPTSAVERVLGINIEDYAERIEEIEVGLWQERRAARERKAARLTA
jgi:hypothetical protein